MPYPGATPVTPVDKQGNVIGGSGAGSTAQTVQGNSTDNTADSGNTVKVGGLVNTTAPTQQVTGVRTPFWVSARGSLIVGGVSATGADATANNSLTAVTNPGGGAGGPLVSASFVFNGTSWDRQRGDATGTYFVDGFRPAGTDRSASATTTSTQLAAANTARRGLEIQNIGANNVGINEFGNTAAIGTAGTYTLAPGASMRVRTNRAVTMIAATATTALTATEW